jgi:hypothetical protein
MGQEDLAPAERPERWSRRSRARRRSSVQWSRVAGVAQAGAGDCRTRIRRVATRASRKQVLVARVTARPRCAARWPGSSAPARAKGATSTVQVTNAPARESWELPGSPRRSVLAAAKVRNPARRVDDTGPSDDGRYCKSRTVADGGNTPAITNECSVQRQSSADCDVAFEPERELEIEPRARAPSRELSPKPRVTL